MAFIYCFRPMTVATKKLVSIAKFNLFLFVVGIILIVVVNQCECFVVVNQCECFVVVNQCECF